MITPSLAAALLALPLLSVLLRLYCTRTDSLNIRWLIVHIVCGAALFGAVGPLIGYFSVGLLSPLGVWLPPSSFTKQPFLLWSDPRFFIGLGYFFLVVPAMLTGVVAGSLKPWLKSWAHCAGIGAVQVIISLLCGGAALNRHGLSFMASVNEIKADETFVLIGTAAFFAGIFSSKLLVVAPNLLLHPTLARRARSDG
jgi:hypothetical protein